MNGTSYIYQQLFITKLTIRSILVVNASDYDQILTIKVSSNSNKLNCVINNEIKLNSYYHNILVSYLHNLLFTCVSRVSYNKNSKHILFLGVATNVPFLS